MPYFQPKWDTRVWYDGRLVNNPDFVSDGLGVHVTAIEGWEGSVDYEDNRQARPGADGEIAGTGRMRGRSVMLGGHVHGSSWSDLQVRKRALSRVLAPTTGEKWLKVQRPVEDVQTYAKLVERLRPIGYWRLGESSGTTAADSSGNAFDGTYNNTPTLGVAGALEEDTDTAVRFASASSEYISVADDDLLHPTAVGSLSFWFRTTASASNLVVWSAGASDMQVIIASGQIRLDDQGVATAVRTSSTYADGEWHHAVVTWDAGTDATIYVDGAAAALDVDTPANFTPVDSNGAINIGRQSTGASYFEGDLDEIHLHGFQLSAAEVTELYNTGQGTFTTPSVDPDATYDDYMVEVLGATAHWRLGESSGTDAAAYRTPDAFDGTYAGGVTLGAAGPIAESATTAASFDGSDDRMSVPYAAALNTAAFSASVWVKFDNVSDDSGVITTRNGNAGGWLIYRNTSNIIDLYTFNGSAVAKNTGFEAQQHRWYHMVFVHDGTNGSLYVDGQLEYGPTAMGYTPNDSQSLFIGRQSGTSSHAGDVARASVFDRALTAAEILAAYELGSTGYTESGMYNYERVGARVVEPIALEEHDGPLRQSFIAGLRASDPRVYNDWEETATSSTVTSSIISVEAENTGLVPVPVTVRLASADTSEPSITVDDAGGAPTSTFDFDLPGTIASGKYVEVQGDNRQVTADIQDLSELLADPIANNNLVWYRLGEASGATASDSGGSASGPYDAAYAGSITYSVTGAFAGEADTAVTVGASATITETNFKTAVDDVKAGSGSSDLWIIVHIKAGSGAKVFRWGDGSTTGFDLSFSGATCTFKTYFTGGSGSASATVPASSSEWYRYELYFTGTAALQLKVYDETGTLLDTRNRGTAWAYPGASDSLVVSGAGSLNVDEIMVMGDTGVAQVVEDTRSYYAGGASTAFGYLNTLTAWPELAPGVNTIDATGTSITAGTLTATWRQGRV